LRDLVTVERFRVLEWGWIQRLVRDDVQFSQVIEEGSEKWAEPDGSARSKLTKTDKLFLLYFSYCLQILATDDTELFGKLRADGWKSAFQKHITDECEGFLQTRKTQIQNGSDAFSSDDTFLEKAGAEYLETILSHEMYKAYYALKPRSRNELPCPVLLSKEPELEDVTEVKVVVPIVPLLSVYTLLNLLVLNMVLKKIRTCKKNGKRSTDGPTERIELFWNLSAYEQSMAMYLKKSLTSIKSTVSYDQIKQLKECEFRSLFNRLFLSCAWPNETGNHKFKHIWNLTQSERYCDMPEQLNMFFRDFKPHGFYLGFKEEATEFDSVAKPLQRYNIKNVYEMYLSELTARVRDSGAGEKLVFVSPVFYNAALQYSLRFLARHSWLKENAEWAACIEDRVFFASYLPPYLSTRVFQEMPFYFDVFSKYEHSPARMNESISRLWSRPRSECKAGELLRAMLYQYIHGTIQALDSSLFAYSEVDSYEALRKMIVDVFGSIGDETRTLLKYI